MARVRDWRRLAAILLLVIGLVLPTGAIAQEEPRTAQPVSESSIGPTSEILPPPTGQAYYVDCNGANDGADGRDAARAWATLARANKATLQPGDALLLKRGCAWTGPLLASWVGSATQPIQIGAYGDGDRPVIQNSNSEVVVTGSFLIFDNLKVRSDPDSVDTACNNNPIGNRTGFSFERGATYNVTQNSVISDLASGVFFTPAAHHNRLVHNELSNNTMMFDADPWRNDGGGQAILLEGDFNEIAYNQIFGSMACSTRFTTDGTAIELYGGQNNAIHHNSTWNNANFTEVTLPRTTNNVYAYNLINGHSAATVHGGSSGTKVYNNVFYSTGGSGDNGVVCYPCTNDVLTFKNNIVWGYGALSTSGTPLDEGHNLYWAPNGHPYLDAPISSSSRVADPLFVDPGVDFHLSIDSPAHGAGSLEILSLGFLHDLNLVPVPQRDTPSVGVYELP
ncbi:MAG TPA: hypothetical protein VGL99_29750 [Chloroflexota bacterium]